VLSVVAGAGPVGVTISRPWWSAAQSVCPDDKETVRSEVLRADFRTVAGLWHVSWEDGSADV